MLAKMPKSFFAVSPKDFFLPSLFSVSQCLRGGFFFYRNFKVVSANSANTSDAIQKRTMIFDSDQPINSK